MAQLVDEQTKSKWRNLVDRLILATDSGVVSWQGSVREGQFLTNLKDKIVTFGISGEEGRTIYYFRIDDDFTDSKIDYFDDEDLDDGRGYSNDNYFARLKDFHNSLSRKVSGADAVLDELLSELPELPKTEKNKNLDDEIPF